MVSSRTPPLRSERGRKHDLDHVQNLVRSECYTFGGDRINRHLSRMSFTEDDVVDAFLRLTESHYQISHQYEKRLSWEDVYHLNHTGRCGNTYDLYIKFRVPASGSIVIICSFHPEGWE